MGKHISESIQFLHNFLLHREWNVSMSTSMYRLLYIDVDIDIYLTVVLTMLVYLALVAYVCMCTQINIPIYD